MKRDLLDWLEIIGLGVAVIVLINIMALSASAVVYCLHAL
jgi:hypothetical protein